MARSFALGVFSGALIVAAPLAALTLAPAGAREAEQRLAVSNEPAAGYYAGSGTPADLPSIIADGVSTSVATAVAAVAPVKAERDLDAAGLPDFETRAPNGATVTRKNGVMVSRAPSGATVTVYPPDAQGRQKVVAIGPNGARAISYTNAHEAVGRGSRQADAIDRAIELKATGVTSDYVAAMRAAAPSLAREDISEFAGMKAVGVTPEFAREWVAAGFRSVTADQLTEARAVGVTGSYVRQMIDAGVRGSFDDYVELRAVGVRPEYVRSLRQSGYAVRSVDQLVELQALGITARDLRAIPPTPPDPPKPPPRDWNPLEDSDPGG